MIAQQVNDNPQIRAIEIKLSQGAKPGKGGVLPAIKVTLEIAKIRGVPADEACSGVNKFQELGEIMGYCPDPVPFDGMASLYETSYQTTKANSTAF